MTLRNFPPADQCSPEDLDAIADLVVSDPRASYDLAGSREHIEALCRRYQALAQDLSVERHRLETERVSSAVRTEERDRARRALLAMTEERDQLKRDERRNLEHISRSEAFAGELHGELATRADAISALERDLARTTNERDILRAGFEEGTARLAQRMVEMTEERDDLRVRAQYDDAARTRLSDLTSECLDDLGNARENERVWREAHMQQAADLDAARKAISEREDEIARVNNERQAEVLDAEADRERADTAESIAEIFEATAKAALAILAKGTNSKPVDLAELARAVDGRVARALVRERAISAAFSTKLEQAMQQLEEHQETAAANDRIRSAFASAVPAICDGVTVEELDAKLDDELAANPDVGPLHHARDQRDHQEDTTP